MSETLDVSKTSGGEKMNNIEHVLNPKIFIKLFTSERCTNEEKLMQEILQRICALRNSGGGKLTIWLTETCSISEIEECADIIGNGIEAVLPDSGILDWESRNRLLTFSIKGSEEVVTMKYNMYVMENNVAKLVPSTKSAAEVRLLIQKQKGQPARKYKTNIAGFEASKLETSTKPDYNDIIEYNVSKPWGGPTSEFHGGSREYGTPQHTLVSSKSPILHFVKDEHVEIPVEGKISKNIIHFESLNNTSTIDKSVANLLLEPENKLQQHVNYFAHHHGGHVYYGISSIGIVQGINVSKGERGKVRKVKEKIAHRMQPYPCNAKVYLKAVKNNSRKTIPNLFVIGIYIPFHFTRRSQSHLYPPLRYRPPVPVAPSQITPETKIQTEVYEKFFKGQVIKPTGMVVFKMLTDKKSRKSESSAAGRITQDQNELLSYVSALANNEGGELYYGIDSHGTVWGERLNQIDEIRREVENEIAKIVWTKHVEILHELCKIFFLPVRHHDDLST